MFTNLKTRFMLVMIILVLMPFSAFAQINIKGTVVDGSGLPVIGASIFEKGTTNGTVSDVDGTFVLTAKENVTLVFSCIGYATQELPAAATMNVILAEDAEFLEETIVIGYGTTKAKNFTGSVDQVKMSDSPVADLNLTSSTDLIRNRLTGVVMGAESGSVGTRSSILVRGRKSVQSTTEEPLIVLNGVIFAGHLDDIDPTTIENISVLKDATSLAAYGSQAAQGVIMVTTKKGREGKPMISFSTSHQISNPSYKIEYLSPADYIRYKNVKGGSTDLTSTSFMTPFELDNYKAGETVNWYDLGIRTGYTQNYNLNVSGASERMNYFVGAGLSDQMGMTLGNSNRRYNISTNLTTKITDWLEVGINFNMSNTIDDSVAVSVGGFNMTPYGEPYLPDGSLRKYVDGQDATQHNPLWNQSGYQDKDNRRSNLNLGGFASIDIPWVKGLNFRLNASWSKIMTNNKSFTHEGYNPTLLSSDIDGLGYTAQYQDLALATGSISHSNQLSWVMDGILSYSRSFGAHYVSASLVYTRDSKEIIAESYSGKDFVNAGNTIKGWHGLGDASVKTVDSPSYSLHNDVGYLARAMYSYKDTYHFNASFRRDGSSVFGASSKWGNFPAVGAAWTMSNEGFMKNAKKIDLLKVKFSWGLNGAQTLSPYGTLTTIALAQSGGISTYYDGVIHWGQRINALGNADLGWQTTSSWNTGIEAEMFKRRVRFEINGYKSKTTDQIFTRNIPVMGSGVTSQKATMGQVDNWGIELNLNTTNIQRGDFTWNTGLIFTLNRNKLVDLYGDGKDDIPNNLFIGEPLGVIYGYEVKGIDPETGTPIYIAADGSETTTPSADEDRKILGYSNENFRFNLSNTFTYKKFQLYFAFNSVIGGNGYGLANNTFAYTTYNTGHSTSALNIPFWAPDNKTDEYPSPAFTNPSGLYQIYNGYGHVRLQDLSLSYNLGGLLKNWGIKNAKVSVAGRNLFVIAPNWRMSDPEARSGSSIALPRAVTFALNLSF